MKKALQTLTDATTKLDATATKFQAEKDEFDARWTENFAECENEFMIKEMGAFAPGFRQYLEEFKSKHEFKSDLIGCRDCKRQTSTLSSCGACVAKNKPYYCDDCSPLLYVPCGTEYDFKSICIDCRQRLKVPHYCKNLFCIDCNAISDPARWKETEMLRSNFKDEIIYRNGCKRPAYITYYNQPFERRVAQEKDIELKLSAFKPLPPM